MSKQQSSDVTPLAVRSTGQEKIPLQVRLAREDIRAIKIAAAEGEKTISEFLLVCFRSWQAKAATEKKVDLKDVAR